MQTTISVLGAGSWGTAVAIHLAHNNPRVLLWCHRLQQAKTMKQERTNTSYLPNINFPDNLEVTSDFDACVADASDIIIAVPSHAFSQMIKRLSKEKIRQGISWLTKGLDPIHHQFLSTLVTNRGGSSCPFAVISGPSFAKEVAQGLPTALVIAGQSNDYLTTIQQRFHHHQVRVYLSQDAIGVQLCGAIKNVLAIACGMSDGLNFGANARAALITRGLAEMSRLGMAMGACRDTFIGLAGVGDLVLTCTDNQSRNRRFGLLLGQGHEIANAEKLIGQVIEGKYNASQVCNLAKQHQIDMPICQEVHAVLQGLRTANDAASRLISRPPKAE